jgi:hypothetical protein
MAAGCQGKVNGVIAPPTAPDLPSAGATNDTEPSGWAVRQEAYLWAMQGNFQTAENSVTFGTGSTLVPQRIGHLGPKPPALSTELPAPVSRPD